MASFFQTKKSQLAVKKEVTEGTPVWPTAATDFIPIQADASIVPAVEKIDNNELSGDIGKAKPINGILSSTGSLSLYLKHSGVEGTAPNYGPLLEAAFGAVSVNATQYTVAAGSTTAIINVGAGVGANFEKGEALLIKDSTNGYSIRTIKSIATDALTLDFELSAAPATGVGLGKAILYKPGTDHPSLTVTDYRGGGAAVQQMAGGRVTQYQLSVTTGQPINQSFTLAGNSFGFNPIEITTSSNKIDFVDDDLAEINTSVPAQTYTDPHELAAAITAAMTGASTDGDIITCSYNDKGANAGKFTIASNGTTLSLLAKTGVNGSDNTDQHIFTKLGFTDSSDKTGAVTYTSASAMDLSNTYSVNFDDADPLIAKNMTAFLGDADDSTCFKINNMTMTIDDTKGDIKTICATTGIFGSLITERAVSVEFQAFIPQYDADKYRRFRENDVVQFLFDFGNKTGGNWVAGQSGCFALHTATLSAFSLTDLDGLVSMSGTLSGYVSSAQPEVFLNFV